MNLYVVQHAVARPEEEDPSRGLSEEGRADIEKVASFASRYAGITAGTIVHSGKPRAEQTAAVLADHLRPAGGMTAADGLAPMDNPSVWAARLADTHEDTILVGHLPHLARLAGLLLCGNESRLPVAFENAGIVCLCRDDLGVWSVGWMLTPAILP
ncbi:MAG TPA: phosphohistidine phosphatase SixA [Acidobacteriota bacterium]|nr:phosphohistidine phosphatase SixA [Acidobacteriota bacterium]